MKSLFSLILSLLYFIPNSSLAQNLDSTAIVGSEYSNTIFLSSQPLLITDMPGWAVGEHPEWADVSIVSEIIGEQYDYDSVLNFYLSISGVPNPDNTGENIITANLINPWMGDVIEVITNVIHVVNIPDCACPMVYAPVCGADGNTYGNDCEASCAGVDILSSDACNPNNEGCQINGEYYEYGASFDIECNSCFCEEGSDGIGLVACTEMDCYGGCYDDPGNYYTNGENWDVDACTFCSCELGEISCAAMACEWPNCENPIYIDGACCPTCPDDNGCFDTTGIYYENGQEWNPSDCEFCSCEQGEIFCAVADCAMPNCDNPINVEGQCCPICPDNCEENNDDIATYGEAYGVSNCTIAVAALEFFGLNCNTDLSEFAPLFGIEIDAGTSLYDFCPCSCENPIEIAGCTDTLASNYNPWATINDNSCEYDCPNVCCMAMDASCLACSACMSIEEYCELYPNTLGCPIYGCTDSTALNYNQNANLDDDSCEYDCNCPLDLWEPVCGENGITYAYNCFAECEEVDYVDGACYEPCVLIDCAEGYECVNGECIGPIDVGCWEEGDFYEIGSVLEGECVSCFCEPTNDTLNPEWICAEIADCGDCSEVNCPIGTYCEMGYCLPVDTVNFGCTENGEWYPFNAVIEAGCNTCICTPGFNPYAEGFWMCTEIACGGCTDPDAVNYNEYAHWDDGSCEYNNNEPDWDFTITGTNHTLILQEDMLTDLFGTPIDSGDWIGSFFEVNGELICAGHTIWEGSTTIIPAQGDDLTTDFQDGFAAGEAFQWIIWDASENLIIEAKATFEAEDQAFFVPNGISVITSLIAVPLISEQEVELNTGWNMFSTYMYNEDMNIQDVFSPYIQDIVIAKNNVGDAYLPEWDFDGIGAMIPGQGYQAKMTANNTLLFEGDYLTPEDHPIILTSGWNIIAYLRTDPAPAIEVFADINDLVIVKNNSGMAYLPEYEYDGIGMMKAGQGYQVKVLSEQILEYIHNDYEYKIAIQK